MSSVLPSAPVTAAVRVPRLGFLGVGWIGLLRLQALARSGAGAVVAVADPAQQRVREARLEVPSCEPVATLGELLALDLDGVVIATPSALHAAQAVHALQHGVAVFCQKPLARTAAETRWVIDAARAAGRLLGVDLSYRHTDALRQVRDVVRAGTIGSIHAVDLVFHNACGPARGWARDPALAGGGCVIDLGIHLVDMLLWVLDGAVIESVASALYVRGERLAPGANGVCEDLAIATVELRGGCTARVACSWEASIGRDAVIEAQFHGARGTAAFRNVNGSFFDFTAELYHGAEARTLAAPPDAWGGRALVEWTRQLADGTRYDESVETLVDVAATLDRMLGR
jgi:predicted dehydrogenase